MHDIVHHPPNGTHQAGEAVSSLPLPPLELCVATVHPDQQHMGPRALRRTHSCEPTLLCQ